MSHEVELPVRMDRDTHTYFDLITLPYWFNSTTKRLLPVFWCSLYLIVGPTLILVNNHIMHHHFHYPILVSMMGVTSSAVLARILVYTGFAAVSEENAAAVQGTDYLRRVLPIGACYALTLSLGNSAYLYIDISLIQMLKCFTPVIVLSVLTIMRIEKPRRSIYSAVFIICFGTILTTSHVKGHINFIGLFFALSASFCEATRLVMTQYLLTTCKFSVVEGHYYLSPAGAAAMLLMAMFNEIPDAIRNQQLGALYEESQLLMISALLGITANYLGYIVIQEVGSLSLKVLSTARSVGLVVYASLIMHEHIADGQIIGYIIALSGFCYYIFLRSTPKVLDTQQLPAKFPPDEEHGINAKPRIGPKRVAAASMSSEEDTSFIGATDCG